MKRLFKVVNRKGNRVYAGNVHEYKQSTDGYFESKADAKKLRDDLTAIDSRFAPYTIAIGVDHWRAQDHDADV